MSTTLSSLIIVVVIYVLMTASLYLPIMVGDLFLLPIGTMAIGAYTYGYLGVHGVSPWIGVPAAVVMAVIVGVIVGWAALRLRGLGTALATLAVVEVINTFFQNFVPTGGSQGLSGIPPLGSMGWALLVGALSIAAIAFVEVGRRGALLHAIETDRLAVESVGVDTRRVRLGLNVWSAGLSAVSGVMLAGYLTYISPDQFGVSALNGFLSGAIMGGTTTVAGAVLGGALTGGLPTFIQFLQDYQLLIYSLLVIGILLFRRQGLVTRDDLTRLARWTRLDRLVPARPQYEAALPDRWQGESLEVRGIAKSFGGVRVLEDVSFRTDSGVVLGIIGPNGAGKTTLLNMLSGVFRPDRGEILVGGRPVWLPAPHRAVKHGIGRTFQNLRLFPHLSALQNVRLATSSGLEGPLLRLVGMEDRGDAPAGSLPYGLQRRLEIARALALEPRVLLLDEPTAGMSHTEFQEIAQVVRALRDQGMTIVLVEHNLAFLQDVADRVLVLDVGRIIADGPPEEVFQQAQVVEAYFGRLHAAPAASDA